MKPKSSKTRRRLKGLRLACYVLLLMPVLQVGCVGVMVPPATAPMAARWVKGKFSTQRQEGSRYRWLKLAEVPKDFLTCVWVAEDNRFFRHHGFDWEEIKIARAEAKASGKPPRGASTITQQCARSLFLWQGRSWLRKGLETYYTVLMELFLSKERILELYVNVIEMGDGVYGIEAAARHHYGIPASELSREQAAMLAAILPNPRLWDPQQPSERVRKRQATILQRAELAWLPLREKE